MRASQPSPTATLARTAFVLANGDEELGKNLLRDTNGTNGFDQDIGTGAPSSSPQKRVSAHRCGVSEDT